MREESSSFSLISSACWSEVVLTVGSGGFDWSPNSVS